MGPLRWFVSAVSLHTLADQLALGCCDERAAVASRKRLRTLLHFLSPRPAVALPRFGRCAVVVRPVRAPQAYKNIDASDVNEKLTEVAKVVQVRHNGQGWPDENGITPAAFRNTCIRQTL